MALNKDQKERFFEKLAAKSSVHDTETPKKVYYGLIKLIMEELKQKEEFELPDWGEYEITETSGRYIKDVNTGERRKIGPKKQIKWSPAHKLKEYVKEMETRFDNLD